MSDCRFGVSPVNYPDPDPDPDPVKLAKLDCLPCNFKQLHRVASLIPYTT